MSAAQLVHEDGRFLVSGVLDFSTVGDLLEQGGTQFGGHKEVLLDLAQVTRANSAGLALLLEWLDRAGRRQQRLRIFNLPDSLAAIARMSNLYQRLPLSKD
jgi:phospholipid transport system transporter-binding protein